MIDAHVHVWDPRRIDYPWLRSVPVLNQPYLPSMIDNADGKATEMIFVEAGAASGAALAEVSWVAGLDWPGLRGIVAAADLRSDALESHLRRVTALDKVVGIRHLLQDDTSAWGDDPALLTGLRTVADHGLTFDACVRSEQLPELIRLLSRAPDTRVVLDHLGKPPVSAGLGSRPGERWATAVRSLAELPSVGVKLSGLTAEATSAGTFARDAKDFLTVALEVFGPERCMIGSDQPVSSRLGVGGDFGRWSALVRQVAADDHSWQHLSRDSAQLYYPLP